MFLVEAVKKAFEAAIEREKAEKYIEEHCLTRKEIKWQ